MSREFGVLPQARLALERAFRGPRLLLRFVRLRHAAASGFPVSACYSMTTRQPGTAIGRRQHAQLPSATLGCFDACVCDWQVLLARTLRILFNSVSRPTSRI